MWVVVITVGLGIVGMAQTNKDDEQIIWNMVTDAIRRLNVGDLSAIREFWDEDADYVGVDGQMLRGRTALESFFSQMLKASATRPTQTARIEQVRFIASDVAIVDGSWTIIGARDASGKELPPLQGRGVEIVRKKQNRWCFVATREMVVWKAR
jgi:uncharacterized protein (TIGR02246 family)